MMDEYKTPYLILFNGITDALEMLDRQELKGVRELLIQAQQKAEETFIAE